MNSDIIIKGFAVILIAAAILIVILGKRGIPLAKIRRGSRARTDNIPKRTALFLNLMIASVMLVFALAMLLPALLKYSIFIMVGVIGLLLILLVAGR